MDTNPQSHKIFEIASDYYYNLMKNSVEAKTYLKDQRKHDPELLKSFKIGWTGTDRKGLYNHLKAHPEISTLGEPGDLDDILCNTGLVASKDGQCYDYFPSEVLVFPLMKGGKINHFRTKDPSKNDKKAYQLPAKFNLNGQLFFNQDDLHKQRIILVEGENDLLSVLRHIRLDGLDLGVIGVLGGMSEEKMKCLLELKNKEFFLFFDADGEFEKSSKGVGYARKFIEASAGILDCNVVRYSDKAEKEDPDSYLRDREKGTLSELIESAQDGVQWYLSQMPEISDKIKARKSIQPALDLIAKFRDDRIDIYIDMLVEKYGFKRQVIVQRLKECGAEIGGPVKQIFEVYDSSTQIFVSDNSYWIPSKDGNRMISNCIIRILNIFAYEDAQTAETWLKYECVLVNYQGVKSKPIIFEPADRVNPLRFMEKVAGQGDYRFWGNAQNLSHIWSFVEQNWEDKKVINLVQKYGFLENHQTWIFDNCAVQKDVVIPKKDNIIKIGEHGFRSENVLVYGGDKPVMNFPKRLTAEEKTDVIENFWQVADGSGSEFKGLICLGWLVASIYRNEIMEKNGSFPLLFFYGPSGTGKTTVAQILFRMFGFVNPPETWESATVASISQMMSQLSCLPVFLDEFRNNSNRQQDALISLLRNAWNGAGAGKGGSKGIRQVFKILSVIMLAGEDLPQDKGGLSRFIVLRFRDLNEQRNAAYRWLGFNRDKMSPFYLNFLLEKTPEKVAYLLSEAARYNEVLLEMGIQDERTRFNYSAVLGGFSLLKYRSDESEFIQKFVEFIRDEALEDISRKQAEDIMQRFFEHVARVMERQPFCYLVKIRDGEELDIAFNEFYHELKKELRQAGDDLDSFKKTTILDYITKSKFFMEQADGRKDRTIRFKMDENPKRAICLNLNKMPVSIRSLFIDEETEKRPTF